MTERLSAGGCALQRQAPLPRETPGETAHGRKEAAAQPGMVRPAGRDGFIHRSWMKNQGFPQDQFDGRPVIGICNTWSELTPCNAHFRELAEHVKRGVLEAGGFPLEFPVMSLGETLLRPTAMLFRNLRRWTSRSRSAAIRSTASCC